MVRLRVGEEVERDGLLRQLVENPVRAQRPVVRAWHVPGPGRHDRGLPGLRAASGAHRDVRRRDRAADDPAPGHRRGPDRGLRGLHLPRHALRGRSRADGTGHRRDRGRARRAAGGARTAGQAAGGPAPADAHVLRHRDDAPGRLLLRHRELLPPHRRPRARLAPPTACSTTSRRTSCSSSTSRTSPCRRSGGCTRATCPASARWSTTGSGCPAPPTTGRCGGRSSSSGSARPSTCPRRRGPTSWPRSTATSSSR